MTLYAAILAVSYLLGYLIVRRLILADQRDLLAKLRSRSIDPEFAKNVIGDADRVLSSLGPAFVYGSFLGLTVCAVAWAMGWAEAFG